ncbi:MAG: helicase [Kouleothrix sp.]|nr:helicase [Kouleothrix sp.]
MSTILHAAWLPSLGRLFMWGEADDAPPRKGRRAKLPAHPFQSSPDQLRALLPERRAPAPDEHAATIWLPSADAAPLPSPELLETGAVATPIGPAELAPWRVGGLLLPIDQALDLLLAPPTGWPGADTRAWRVAALLAMEIVARQQVLPALWREGFQLRAAWQVSPEPATAQKLAALAGSLPPLCRAVVSIPAEAPPPRALLDDFLAKAVDATIRGLAQLDQAPTTKDQSGAASEKPRARGRSSAAQPSSNVKDQGVAGGLSPLVFRPSSTPAGKWLAALLGPDPAVDLKGPEADALYKAWQAWAGQGQAAGDDAFRITFRLEPPEQADEPWTLAFLLRATDDPSLIVPAGQIWRERGAALNYLNRRFEHPQERLLAGLGYAARIFPPLEQGLRQQAPERARISAQDAFVFLKEAAPLLEQSGFGIMVPAWWQSRGARLQARARAKAKGAGPNAKSLLNFDALVSFNWELTLGGEPIDRAEFERLARLKQPLVQVRGQWVVLDPEQIEQALKFFERRDGEATLIDVLQLGLGGDGQPAPAGVEFAGMEAEGWLRDLLENLSDTQQLDLLPVPQELQAQLRPYQVRGFSWMEFLRRFGLGACLADDMGLGKCMTGDTLIFINGTLQTAESIWGSYASAATFDGEGFWAEPAASLLANAIDRSSRQIVLSPISRLYRQQVREQLRTVLLEDGSKITITRRHRLLTNRGWTNQLQAGDYVCVPAKMVWHGVDEDLDLITFMAWQIAEGYELPTKATLTITQKDVARLEHLRQLLENIGRRYDLTINNPAIRHPAHGYTPYLAINSRSYQQFLDARGYQWGNLSRNKVIPDFIMQSSQQSVSCFLRNYFEAEGSAVLGMRGIEISTASYVLMQQLSALLRRFGIWMRIMVKSKRATNGSNIFRTYYSGFIGGNGARIFMREIGFASERKQQRLKDICEHDVNTNIEGIPASELVSGAIKVSKLPIRHFGMHNTVYIDGSQQFSRLSLERVVSSTDHILSGESAQEYRQQKNSKWTKQTLDAYAQLDLCQLQATRQNLQQLLDQQVFYCRIKSVEDVEYDGWVYDFEVAEHHNFVANNILCHNTVQTIATLLHEKEQAPQQPPTLIVCPTSVVGNWQREIGRFAPSLRVMLHRGSDRQSGAAFAQAARRHDVVLTSFPLLARDRETLAEVEWSTLVLDEAQNIKNAATKQAQAARALRAAGRVALTGTPVENRLTELWSIMAFLNPGYLGSEAAFKREYARPIERTGDRQATERLRRLTAPFVLRRLKTDPTIIADLPDKLEMKVYCQLTQEQATLYEAVVREALEKVAQAEQEGSAIQRRGQVLSMLMQLKQVCNHPAQFAKDHSGLGGRSGKLSRLTEMLEEVYAAGDRALVFTQFAEMGGMLQRHLRETFYDEVLFLHGGTPAKERDAMVRRFQAPHGPRVFILSLKAGGTGLNLTAASHVFHFDRWWNPAVENQATDRAFRIGQTRNVQVHKFICGGTLEDRIDEMIESKRALAESVLGADEGWLTELNTAQLRDLVALRRDEAVEV